MPMNRFMDPRGSYPSPGNTMTRATRARVNAAAMGSPDTVDAFFYSTPLRQVAAGGTDTFSIPVNEDAEFVCEWLTGILTDDNGGVVNPGTVDGSFTSFATVLITDTGSGRQIMDRPIYWHSIVGTAQRPTYLAVPKHFRPSGSIQVTVTDLISNALFWQLVLGGVKLYKVGRS